MNNPVDYLTKKWPMKLGKQDTFSKMEVLEMLEEIQQIEKPVENKYETVYYLVEGSAGDFRTSVNRKAKEGYFPQGSISSCYACGELMYSVLMSRTSLVV